MEQDKRQELIQAGQKLKEELATYEDSLREVENALQFEAQRLPNLTHPDAAIGGEEEAILLKEIGSKRAFDFEVHRSTLACALCTLGQLSPSPQHTLKSSYIKSLVQPTSMCCRSGITSISWKHWT